MSRDKATYDPERMATLLERVVGKRQPGPEPMYRCGECLDVGWIETDPTGRGTWKRCVGKTNVGCPYDRWRVEENKKRRDRGKAPARELTP